MAEAVDVAVVGAGLLGLATARELLRRRPGLKLVILEKEPVVAAAQSGRNSGVIHSGVYYRPGSQKAKLCVAGRRALLEFCDETAIPYNVCGKLIVAQGDHELPRLEELQRRGEANGVTGLLRLGPTQLRDVEPSARGAAALWVPQTAITDYGSVARGLAQAVIAGGGELRFSCALRSVSPRTGGLVLHTSTGDVLAGAMVSCAGLESDRIARLSGAGPDPQIVPFRGTYLRLRPRGAALVRSLIYPVPDPALPFLGVHFTRRLDGSVLLGPNAVLSMSRAATPTLRERRCDTIETLRWPGTWRLARRHWRYGAGELRRDLQRRALVDAARRYVPDLSDADVETGPWGLRAQALARNGHLVDDFVFATAPRILHVRNAPSPAATASLAIAGVITDALERHLAGSETHDAFGQIA